MPVIITGPAGCGKTRNAEKLRKAFCCATVVDEWDGHSRLARGALALTNLEPGQFDAPRGTELYTFEQAMWRVS